MFIQDDVDKDINFIKVFAKGNCFYQFLLFIRIVRLKRIILIHFIKQVIRFKFYNIFVDIIFLNYFMSLYDLKTITIFILYFMVNNLININSNLL